MSSARPSTGARELVPTESKDGADTFFNFSAANANFLLFDTRVFRCLNQRRGKLINVLVGDK
jgi:hypothetical protein